MKKITCITTILTVCAVLLSSCNKDNENTLTENKYYNDLEQLFPNAAHVEWSSVGEYGVAEFNHNGSKTKVWFTDNATSSWQMTETDVLYANLPQAIKTALETGEYSSWRVDDIDKLDRAGVETIYVIEIEREEAEISLYYSVDGVLIKMTEDLDDDNQTSLPPTENIATEIMSYITTNYPGAKIADKDIENGVVEIDIIHDNKHKEIKFNSLNEWVSTCTDLTEAQTPQLVKTAISSNPGYAGYHIDDVEFWQTKQGNYYMIELEGTNADIDVKVSEAGVIL